MAHTGDDLGTALAECVATCYTNTSKPCASYCYTCNAYGFINAASLHMTKKTQNSYGEGTRRTPYACMRADCGNKDCGTHYDYTHNCHRQTQHICKALNNGSAVNDIETIAVDMQPVKQGKSHALDKGKYDASSRQDRHQKREYIDMQPMLNDAALISGQSERRVQGQATKSTCIYWQKSEKQR